MMEFGFLLLLVGAALAGAPRARVTGGVAAVAAGLALAALKAGPRSAPEPAALAHLSRGFVAANAALLVVAGLLAAAGSLAAFRGVRRSSWGGGVALLAGGAVILTAGWPLLSAAPPATVGAALVVVLGVGAAAAALGRWVRFVPSAWGPAPWPRAAVAGVLIGTVLAGIGPHVALIFAGVILAAWSGFALRRSGAGARLPIAPAVALLLAPAYWLLTTVAGPEGLQVATLSMLPLSPAAERLLAPVFLMVGWVLAGLWPLHRQGRGVLLTAAGMLLFVRVALPTVPDGLDHWRPLVMPVVVLGLWHAAMSGSWSGVAVALGWVALLGTGAAGVPAAALLLGTGLVLQPLAAARLPERWIQPIGATAAVALGGGALLAVEQGLRGEVVYTVLAVLAIVAAITGTAAPQAITPSAPSATTPSA